MSAVSGAQFQCTDLAQDVQQLGLPEGLLHEGHLGAQRHVALLHQDVEVLPVRAAALRPAAVVAHERRVRASRRHRHGLLHWVALSQELSDPNNTLT